MAFWTEAFLEDVTDHIQINYVFSTHSEETSVNFAFIEERDSLSSHK